MIFITIYLYDQIRPKLGEGSVASAVRIYNECVLAGGFLLCLNLKGSYDHKVLIRLA